MEVYYTAVSVISAAALLLLCCMILQNVIIPARARRFFCLAAYASLFVIAAEEATNQFLIRGAAYVLPNALANMVGFGLSPVIPLLIGCAIGHPSHSLRNCFSLPAVINGLFCLLSPWLGLIFRVSAQNEYTRGAFFPVFVAAYVFSMLFLLVETRQFIRLYQNKNRLTLLLLFLFVVLGTSVQVFYPVLHLSWLCIAFSMTLYYAFFCELNQQLDPLTRLLNRMAYESQVQKLANAPQAAVLIFDVDDFKAANDAYGHAFGDQCLITVSDSILASFSSLGLCYRIGGDEFCVLSRHAAESAMLEAQKSFLSKIAAAREQDPRLPMVSLGLSVYQRNTGDFPSAIRKADQQMYHFKERHKAQDPNQCELQNFDK